MLRWVPVPTPPAAGISLFGAGTETETVAFRSAKVAWQRYFAERKTT